MIASHVHAQFLENFPSFVDLQNNQLYFTEIFEHNMPISTMIRLVSSTEENYG